MFKKLWHYIGNKGFMMEKIDTTGWGSIKKMCRNCGMESEISFDLEHCKPPIDKFPCSCGAKDFMEITHFSENNV